MTVAKEEAFPFIIFSMICGFVAIYLTNNVRRRSRLVMAGAYSGVACVLLASTLGFTGFGVRWFSPVGPLRFEWGIPLTPRPQDQPVLFEFTIGNFF